MNLILPKLSLGGSGKMRWLSLRSGSEERKVIEARHVRITKQQVLSRLVETESPF